MTLTDLPMLPEADVAPSARILILGAGYGGLRTAQLLAKNFDGPNHPEIVLVDRYDYHQVITELPEAASGRISTDDVALPFDALLKKAAVRFVQAEIEDINFDDRLVTTSRGIISYGTIVVSLGSVTAFYGIPGLEERALTLKSVEDADAIEKRVREAIAKAANATTPTEKTAWGSIIVGGAGLTGVELAGEIAELLPTLVKEHNLAPNIARVLLVEGAPAVLPSFPERLQSESAHILSDLGVRLSLGANVASADDDGVTLSTGDRLVGKTIIWTGGIMAPAILKEAGLPTVRNGQVPVDGYLRVEGHPEIYVIGDSARVMDASGQGFLNATAQVAVKQAESVAYNIVAANNEYALRQYRPSDKGQVVSLGTESGVAAVLHIPITGRKTLALKKLIAEGYRFDVTGRLPFIRRHG